MAMLLYADSQFTSPYAMSAFVALTEKQLPFEVRTLDLAIGANNDPEYAKTSLTQRVPGRFKRGCEAISCRSARNVQRPPCLPADLHGALFGWAIASRKLCAAASELLSHG